MNIKLVIEVLKKIDEFLWWGDRDTAHEMILKLIADLEKNLKN